MIKEEKGRITAITAGLIAAAIVLAIIAGFFLVRSPPKPEPKPAVFRYPAIWPLPPGYHGNPYGPGGLGGVYYMMYEPLFYYVPGEDSFREGLGTKFELKEGGRVLEVKVREALWHDGKPFTSKDVVTHFKMIGAIWGGYVEIIDDITAPDARTVRFKLAFPLSEVIKRGLLCEIMFTPDHIFGKYVPQAEEIYKLRKEESKLMENYENVPERELPKEVKNKLNELEKKINDKLKPFSDEITGLRFVPPIGTGPYKFKSVTPSELTLEKFENHWKADTILIDTVIAGPRWIGNEVVWTAFMGGELDTGHPATPPHVVEQIRESVKARGGELEIAQPPGLETFGWILNFRKWPYCELDFRKALAYIMDPKLIREASSPFGIEITRFQHGILPSLEEKYLTPEFLATLTDYTTNHAKATELLERLGFTKSPEGIWQFNGKDFEIWLRPYGPHTDWVMAAEVYAKQLRDFGFKVKIDPIPVGTAEATYLEGKFDIAMEFKEMWWGTIHPADGYKRIYGGAWQKYCGYDMWPVIKIGGVEYNTKALVSRLRKATTPEEVKEVVEKLAYVTNEWLPGISFLQKRPQLFIVDGIRVTGWPPLDDPIYTFAFDGIERIYVLLLRDGILKPV